MIDAEPGVLLSGVCNAADSQSSLCAASINSTQVVDDTRQPFVNCLLNEVLDSIFCALGRASLFSVMLVCKRWAARAGRLLWRYPSYCKRFNWKTLVEKTPYLNYCDLINGLTLNGDVTDESDFRAGVDRCNALRNVDVSDCAISEKSFNTLAKRCRYITSLRLCNCAELRDEVVDAFAANCPNILAIDFSWCEHVTVAPIAALLSKVNLRELRLVKCDRIGDAVFLNLSHGEAFKDLHTLCLGGYTRVSPAAISAILKAAPMLRHLAFDDCNITDAAVDAISELGRHLHYISLESNAEITDDCVNVLQANCTDLRTINLDYCEKLTDDSVNRLALLPKLEALSLCGCHRITDVSTLAAVSNLERIALQSCKQVTLESIIKLVHSCPRLVYLHLPDVVALQSNQFKMAADRNGLEVVA